MLVVIITGIILDHVISCDMFFLIVMMLYGAAMGQGRLTCLVNANQLSPV